jgi:hypothetical protein
VRFWPKTDDPNARVFAVIEDSMGRAHGLLSRPNAAAIESVRSSEVEALRAFTWIVHQSDFMHADGSPVSLDEIDAIHVRHRDEERVESAGACRRCLSPWGTAPQPVHAGDSCLPPIFEESSMWTFAGHTPRETPRGHLDAIGLQRLDSMRSQVRIEWPKDCDCALDQPPAATTTTTWQLAPLSPSVDPGIVNAMAQAPDGTFGGFSAQYALVVTPDGRRFEATGSLLKGDTLAAVALPPAGSSTFARFLVAATRDDLLASVNTEFRLFEVVSGRLESREAVIDGINRVSPFYPNRMGPSADASGRIAVAGRLLNTPFINPVAALCSPTIDGLTCLDLGLDCGQKSGGEVIELLSLPDQSMFAVFRATSTRDERFAFRPSNGSWICDTETLTRAFANPLGGAVLHVSAVNVVASFGDRVFTCATSSSDGMTDGPEIVLTASVSSAGLAASGSLGTHWTLVTAFPEPRTCIAFSPVLDAPGEPRLLRLTTIQGDAIDLTRSGAIAAMSPLDGLYPDLAPVSALFSLSPQWTIATTGSGGAVDFLHLAPPIAIARRSAGRAFERFYGTTSEPRPWYRAVVENNGALVAFGDGIVHRVIIPTRGPRGASVETLAVTGLPSGFHIHDGATETGGEHAGSVLAVGELDDEPAIFRLGLDRAIADRITVSGVSAGPLVRIAEVLPGQFLTMTRQQMFWMKDDVVTAIGDAPADDPLTTEIEGVDTSAYSAVAASGGVAWVLGRSRVVRVRAPASQTASPASAETFSVGPRRTDGISVSPASLSQAFAFCPDQVILGTDDKVLEARGRTDGSDDTSMSNHEIIVETSIHLDEGPAVLPSAYFALTSIVGRAPDTTFFFYTRRVARHGLYLPRAPFLLNGAGGDSEGRVLIAGPDGRLVLGYDSKP